MRKERATAVNYRKVLVNPNPSVVRAARHTVPYLTPHRNVVPPRRSANQLAPSARSCARHSVPIDSANA